jgi:hypothetical protein
MSQPPNKKPFPTLQSLINFLNSLLPEDVPSPHTDGDNPNIVYVNPLVQPKEEWFDSASVKTPEPFQDFLDNIENITAEEMAAIEEALESYYKIESPWYLCVSVFSTKVHAKKPQTYHKPLIFDLRKEV